MYGKLNKETIVKEYTGQITDTSETIVDEVDNKIKVNLLKTPTSLTIEQGGEKIVFNGSNYKTVSVPSKAKGVEYILYKDNWEGNVYTLLVEGKTPENNALVANSNEGSDEQIFDNSAAIAQANIYKTIDNGDSIIFVCENVPEIDLKIYVEVYD